MKTLLCGMALALGAGMSAGAAMQPDLGWDGRPAGPQMFTALPGARPTGPFDDGATFASYGGRVPDYVLGSDWKRREQADARARVEPEIDVRYHAFPRQEAYTSIETTPVEAARVETASVDSEAHAPVSYPSQDGGVDYHANDPPAPPVEPGVTITG